MRKLFLLLAALLPLIAGAASAPAPVAAPAAAPKAAPAAELSTVDALIFGVVEGVTEFLPVSSTGHMIIATKFMGLESETPLTDSNGQPIYYKKPSAKLPAGIPMTTKLAADTYNVVIQFGAIAAVALLYWPQIVSMILGLLGRDPDGRKLLINVIVAFLPAAAIGFVAHDWIEEHLFSVGTVIAAQIIGAILMLYAEAWRRRHLAERAAKPVPHELANLTPKSALGIGFLQCIAMCPGTSRSMTTIVGGYFAGLDPRRAAEFSFLLGFATLTGATVLKSYKSGAAMIQVFGWSHVLLGAIVAAIVAAVCVRFLVHWLTRHGLAVFAYYRIIVAVVLACIFYL